MTDSDDGLLVLDAPSVREALAGRETKVVDAVQAAYIAHAVGHGELPHSVFLRFPHAPENRIIALPAYLGGDWDIAGLKWIASFPGNLRRGIDRASAILILNSATTGRPYAIMSASQISAQRTAASAALAARYLWQPGKGGHVAVIGCGVIALEILRFLQHTVRPLQVVKVHDLSQLRRKAFVEQFASDFPDVRSEEADGPEQALRGADLVVFATTAATPHIADRTWFEPGATVLHVSLRDLTPELILVFDNVVDDVDHVCRAETSLHLAQKLRGDRHFIRTTLASIVAGTTPARALDSDIVVFSPFGLGVLDLAVGDLVERVARDRKLGVGVPSFLSKPRGLSSDESHRSLSTALE